MGLCNSKDKKEEGQEKKEVQENGKENTKEEAKTETERYGLRRHLLGVKKLFFFFFFFLLKGGDSILDVCCWMMVLGLNIPFWVGSCSADRCIGAPSRGCQGVSQRICGGESSEGGIHNRQGVASQHPEQTARHLFSMESS